MDYSAISNILDINADLLNILRCHNNIDRYQLTHLMNQSWPTISKSLDELKANNILKSDYVVNPELGYYVGVSIGGSQIKLSIIDFTFHPLSYLKFNELTTKYNLFYDIKNVRFARQDQEWGYIYIDTPNTTSELQDILDNMLGEIIKLDIKLADDQQHIYGIGLAFTGAIDNQDKKIIQAYSLKCFDTLPLSYDSLIFNSKLSYFNRNNIHFSMDNIAKAAIISEKFNLYNIDNSNHIYYNKKNVACIYLGSGLGGSLIFSNTLYRGTSNFNELGHIDVIDPDFFDPNKHLDDINETCSCGGKTCLEFKIRKNVFSLNYDKFKTQTASELLEYFNGLNDKEYRLHLLAFYINQAIKALTNILNIDLVILTGKLTVFMDDLSKYLYEEKSKNPIGYTNSDCTMITSTYGALAPSIGAAISSSLPENSDLIRWK